MSVMPASKITDPRELYEPTADEAQVEHLLRDHLDDEGRRAFLSELMAAIREAKVEGDLYHVNTVLEAWTRTAIMANGDFQARWDTAERDAENLDGETLTLEEIKLRLSL